MASDLFTPILNQRTRSPNFFNGRLLTGEAMTDEQRAQRTARELMAQAVGDGVAYGLEVAKAGDVDHPMVNVTQGVAINRSGEILLLAADTQVQLVRPADPAAEPGTIFRTCTPATTGTYVADAGLYLLTVSSIRSGNGLAQVSGLGDTPRACNIKYVVDAVEFRLLELPLDETLLGAPLRLQNAVAYQCFGVGHLVDFATDPFATDALSAGEPQTLLDQIRGIDLTDCDVPLAILYWTATDGVQFVDMWAVRRRLTHTKTASDFGLDDARLAAAEAMREQFRAQLEVIREGSSLGSYQAKTAFRWLPPAGLVPLSSGSGATGFDAGNFFTGKTWNLHPHWPAPIYMEGGMVETLLRVSAQYPPVDLDDKEMVWLYSVRENIRALATGHTVQPYLVFANANLPFFGEPRFDRAHANYSNLL
jgi:hypothetical protein